MGAYYGARAMGAADVDPARRRVGLRALAASAVVVTVVVAAFAFRPSPGGTQILPLLQSAPSDPRAEFAVGT